MHIKAYNMCDGVVHADRAATQLQPNRLGLKKPITIVINCVFNPIQWEKLFEMSEEASQQIIDEYPS